MPEHVHLLIDEPRKGNPSKGIQVLKQRVSASVLSRERYCKDTKGHFWYRRFYICAVRVAQRLFAVRFCRLNVSPSRTYDCGPDWLKDSEIAEIAERAILRGADLGQYELRAYVFMPNHVHVLLDPLVPMPKLTSGIKGVSARHANLKLGRTGSHFWQDESFDHWIRNEGQLVRAKVYIENNPVKAGLCAKPEDWRWSSAHK